MRSILEARASERIVEAEQKQDLINKIQLIKLRIDEENRLNEIVILQRVKEKEEADIRVIDKSIEAIWHQKSIYDECIKDLTAEVQRLADEKVSNKQRIVDYNYDIEIRDREIRNAKQKYSELLRDNEWMDGVLQDLEAHVKTHHFFLIPCFRSFKGKNR